MGSQFAELPDWEFSIQEVEPGKFRAIGVRNGGVTGDATGVDPDDLMDELRVWAVGVEKDLSRTREFRGMVWVACQPGERVVIRAESATSAAEKLRTRFGKEAVVSLWNEDDAASSREGGSE